MTAHETSRAPGEMEDLARSLRQAHEELFALGRALSDLAAAYDEFPTTSWVRRTVRPVWR